MLSTWYNYITQHDWIIKISAAVLLGLVLTIAEYFIYRHYLPHSRKKNKVWRSVFIVAFHTPFLVYLWFIVVTLVLQTVLVDYSHITATLNPARRVLALVCLLWFVMRYVQRGEQQYIQSMKRGAAKTFRDITSVNATAQVVRIVAILIIALMMMKSFGIPISTLLAFGGIGGLAISFAAKDTLSNFIGGLMIFWDRPFSVGDWISSPDRQIEGTVTRIGWRLTSVTSFEKRPLYVPNGVFSNIVVENPSRMLNRRIKVIVGLRYEDAEKVSAITQAIEQMLRQHPEIDTTQTLFVYLVEFGASALNILVYTFTKTTDWIKFQAAQHDVFLKIIDIVSQHGAEMSYPTQTVHIPQGIECFHLAEENGESDDTRNLQ